MRAPYLPWLTCIRFQRPETAPPSTTPVDELTLTQVDIGDSQTTDVGDGGDIAEVDGPAVRRRVDGSGLVIAFNSNRSDEDGGRSGERSQPRGPSRMNGSPGRGLSLPEPHSNAGV